MTDQPTTVDDTAAAQVLEVRRRRAELRESIDGLEAALAQPGTGREAEWTAMVLDRTHKLEADLAIHLEVAESDHGLHAHVLEDAPHLAPKVLRMQRDHVEINERLATVHDLVDAPPADVDVEAVRDELTGLISLLVRHRQRGADLLWEAYSANLGGET